MRFNVRLHWMQSNAKRRLATFASGRLNAACLKWANHSATIVSSREVLSNSLQSLRPAETFRKLSMT